MITIDLERDTPSVLAEYVAEYSPKIIGLRGTDQQVDDVCNHFRCYRSKGQAYDDPGDYILDHTVTQYIIDPEGKTVGYFLSNRGLEERVPIFLDHVERYKEKKLADAAAAVEQEQSELTVLEKVRQFFGVSASPAT
jgi:protein SCO1/2